MEEKNTELKCWKKTYEISNFKRYENKKGGTIGIWVNPSEVSVLNKKLKSVAHRTFDDKSQAIKFANKYMKEHDKC